MAKVYGFHDRETAEALASMVRRAPRRVRKPTHALRPTGSPPATPAQHYLVRITSAGVSPRDGSQPGTGEAEIVRLVDGLLEVQSASGILTIWNAYRKGIGGNAYTFARRDAYGVLWVDMPPVLDLRVQDLNLQLQTNVDTNSGWVTWHEGGDCEDDGAPNPI